MNLKREYQLPKQKQIKNLVICYFAVMGFVGSLTTINFAVNLTNKINHEIFGTGVIQVVRARDIEPSPIIESDANNNEPVDSEGLSEEKTLETPEEIEERIREVFGEKGDVAVRIGECESKLGLYSVNTAGNNPPSTDRGVFQINDHWHPEVSDECAFDNNCNIQEAFRISKGGTDWSQWSCSSKI